ncbi:MAG: hypothetical protein K6E29_00605 [Cyanobacteria bacterium RUI128]|nr:hypothetical protein [Cyanobacteria bacterium RUI128]
MKVNNIQNIKFTATNNSTVIAPRSQQQQNKVNFEKERLIAQKADSVNANPITSLGYKLYRTFRFLSEHETPNAQQLNYVA